MGPSIVAALALAVLVLAVLRRSGPLTVVAVGIAVTALTPAAAWVTYWLA